MQAHPIIFRFMITLRLLPFALAAICSAAPCFANEPAAPAAASEATPAAETTPATEEATPASMVRSFFISLGKGDVDSAYDELLKGTRIAETPTDVLMLKKKTRDALKMVGGIRGAELLDRKTPGSHLTSLTYVSLGEAYPLQWRFFFYKSGTGWKLIDIRISDRLPELFGEPAEASSPNS